MPSSTKKILVSGFGAFADVVTNPSSALLPELERLLAAGEPEYRWEFLSELPVRPDVFTTTVSVRNWDVYFALGVDRKATGPRLELYARNRYCSSDAGIQDLLEKGSAPDRLRKNTWLEESLRDLTDLEIGDEKSCGVYVCNATYYLALAQERPVFFIHIPPVPPEKNSTMAQQLAFPMRLLASRALERARPR